MKALTDLFREWMPHQRWFGGKGREWADVSEDGFLLDRGNPVLSVHRVRISYTDGHTETYLVPLSWRDHPAEDLESAFVGAVPERRPARATPTTRCATGTRPTPWLIHLVNASTIGPMHFHPGGVAYIPEGLPGRHRLRRAEQHLADLRVRGDPQAVPPAGAGAQPRRRGARRPAAARRTSTSPRCSATSRSTTPTRRPRRRRSRCCRRSCPTPATAGGWRRPACATSTPRATCTPTRWAATSPPRASGWARPRRRCTPTWPRCCRPSPPAAEWFAATARQMTERLEAATEVVPQLAEHADGLRALYAAVADSTRARRPPAGARRPAPGPGPADGDRVDRARLRGRARPAAGRPPGARQPAARRRRDAAQLRLRRPAHAGRAARRPPARLPRAGVGRPQPQRVLHRLLRRRAASTRAGNHHSFGRSRPTRRCTSASTRHATVRTG